MGYSTSYTLTWKLLPGKENSTVPNCEHDFPKTAKFCPECGTTVGNKDFSAQVSSYLEKAQKEDDSAFYAIDSDGQSGEACKWYHHDSDMEKISKKFPNVLFTLNGEGEESGDIWNKYYVNGKVQVEVATLVFGEFDPKKLKKIDRV